MQALGRAGRGSRTRGGAAGKARLDRVVPGLGRVYGRGASGMCKAPMGRSGLSQPFLLQRV